MLDDDVGKVWLLWVNNDVEEVYGSEVGGLRGLVDFLSSNNGGRDDPWLSLTPRRWSNNEFARIELICRELKS